MLLRFGFTEPDAGLNTTRIKPFAEKVPGGYRVHGQKVWTSTAQVANKIMLLTRTTRFEDCRRPTDGITIFYTDLDRSKIEVRRIPKMGRKAMDSNAIFIDGLFIPDEDRIGEEGRGFSYILHSLNPERILIAVEAIGIGQDALRRATRYARERVVFDRPIGQNQGIQHPRAEKWMYLESAWLMAMRAAWLYDNGKPYGAEANSAKFLGARAGHDAAWQAIMTHGGFGYTPMFLAGFAVNQIWDELTDAPRRKGILFDPACGSGIFLVRLFQRLVAAHCRAAEKCFATWKDLSTIVQRLHGADIDASAVRVAAFSFYIAPLEHSNPCDLDARSRKGSGCRRCLAAHYVRGLFRHARRPPLRRGGR